ncbi:MAG: hypothetical protein JNK77_08780 [Saprospiraceae bacterium]|nr:hypothetical protein [Saprospiraceae bacterium]
MEEKSKSFDRLQHKNNVLELENQKLKLEKKIQEMYEPVDFPGEKEIYKEMITLIDGILKDVGQESAPEFILKKALSHLRKVDQQKFVLENLLEGIKRGQDVSFLVETYQHLGLMTSPPPPPDPNNPNQAPVANSAPYYPPLPVQPTSPSPQDGKGSWLWNLITGPLKRIATRLMSMITNAMRSIPHFIDIKPIVGFTGIFPSLSFQLETGDMNLHEFWELLMGNEDADND